jgi:hypothetical protein
VLGLALALGCGKSARNGGEAAPEADAGEGGQSERGGAPVSGGSANGGSANGGSANGGQSGAPIQGGEWAGAGATNGGDAAAGAGGEPPVPPAPRCDDGNDCTLDFVVSGACRHEAVPNGTPCDDGSSCTLGDRCAAAACVSGIPQSGPGQVLGSLSSYGNGLALGAGNGRFAFVDAPTSPARLTLADVATGELRESAHTDVHPDVGYSFIGAAWDDLLVIADGATSAVLNGPSRYLQLFTMEASGSLTPHTPTPITPGSVTIPANTSLAGRGSSLFLCHNFAFLGAPSGTLMWWDVADPDAPIVVAQGSTNGQCGSVAVSEDGQRVYVNTVNGVLWSDLSTHTSGDLTFAAQPLIATDAGLHVRGDRLLARSGPLLRLLNEGDHTELSSFTIDGARAAALTAPGLFVERTSTVANETLTSVSLRTGTGGAIDELPTLAYRYSKTFASSRPIVSGTYAMDSVTRRLFSLSQTGLQELNAPELGAMSWAFAGPSALHVRGTLTAHRVDLRNPAAPTILAGGPTRKPTAGIELQLLPGAAHLVPETEPAAFSVDGNDAAKVIIQPALGHATGARVLVTQADESEHWKVEGFVDLPGGSAELLSAGGAIYRAAYATSGGVRLQRFQIADLRDGATEPNWELDFEAPAVTARSVTVRFDVDSRAGVALLSTSWAEASAVVTKMYFVDVLAGTSSPADTLSSALLDLKVRGDSWVYVRRTPTYTTELVFRSRADASERVFPGADGITRLLGFDGDTAYYAASNALRAVRSTTPPVSSLNLVTRGTPTSLAETEGAMVAITPGGLLTFAPPCEHEGRP